MPFTPSPLNPLFAVAVTLTALSISTLLVRLFGKPPVMGRFTSLDGLRGFLVMGVFIHHAAVWYVYLHGGHWAAPKSHLYAHLGQSGVALFFMITAFLFTGKLLNGHQKPIDWLQLYISRTLRLLPLYLLVMMILFLAVFASTGWALHESIATLADEAWQWLGFTIAGQPDINGLHQTNIAVAGVTWSLPYECLFYAALPLGALLIGLKPANRTIIWSAIACAAISLIMHYPSLKFLVTFSGGIGAAFCVRSERLRTMLSGTKGAWMTLVCFSLAVIGFPSGYDFPAVLLFSIGFTAIACGNTLFGILALPGSRLLGDIAYSIYLLHGLLLFVTFHFIETPATAAAQSVAFYWLVILGLTLPLVIVCYASFRFIEYPAIQSAPRLRQWLSARA